MLSSVVSAADRKMVILTDVHASLFEDPTGTNPTSVDNLEFGRGYPVLEESGGYLNITIGTKELWVEKSGNHILDKKRKSTNFWMAEKTKEGKGKLTRKALIINKPTKDSLLVEVPFYDNPNLSGKAIGKISIFEVRFIFAKTSKSVLLGKEDRFNLNNSKAVLVGWISSEFVEEWNNRIGIEFLSKNSNKRKKCEVVKIYHTERNAKKRIKEIFKEGVNDSTLPYYAHRFPVLEKKYAGAIYKIAYIGNAKGGGGSFKKSDIDNATHKIDLLLSSSNVEIMILIDATSGMRKHIENVKKAVIRFLKEKKKTRVAIAVYRDYPDKEKVFELMTNFTKDMDELETAISKITVESNKADKGIGTYPEALFKGINTAAFDSSVSWNNDGLKYMVVIGDHGNHEDYSQYPQDKEFSSFSIAKSLKAKKISLFSVQVNLSKEKRQYNRMFEKQILAIVANNKPQGGFRKAKGNSTSTIFEALVDVFMSNQKAKKFLVEVRNNSQMSDIYKGEYASELLLRLGIDPEIFKSQQLTSIGYIPNKNKCGESQVEPYVLIKKNSLEELKVNLAALVDEIRYYDREEEDKFKRVVYNSVMNITGDRISPDETISEFIEKRTGVPIQTSFLKLSVTQLLDRMIDEKTREVFIKELEPKLIKLEAFTKEREALINSWDNVEQTFPHQFSDVKQNHFFSLSQPLEDRGKIKVKSYKKRHAWVPMNLLP